MTSTDYSELEVFLRREGIGCRRGEPLSEHCSFRIGGAADVFATPGSAAETAGLINFCREKGIRYFILGRGTNLLFDDLGFRGVVISLAAMEGVEMLGEGTDIKCGCGTFLGRACAFARDNGLSGMETLFGIPGSVGGAVYMNAGAYGREIKDVCTSVEVLGESGEISAIENGDCRFGYRSSAFQSGGRIILSASFRLEYGDRTEIEREMARVVEQRNLKQPLNYPSAGSAFKRPKGDFASRLIDACDLKGLAVGGAQVSEKHAGFIINRGGAKSADVLSLIEKVKNEVFRRTGILLEPEVEYVSAE